MKDHLGKRLKPKLEQIKELIDIEIFDLKFFIKELENTRQIK